MTPESPAKPSALDIEEIMTPTIREPQGDICQRCEGSGAVLTNSGYAVTCPECNNGIVEPPKPAPVPMVADSGWVVGEGPPDAEGTYLCCIYDEEPTVDPAWQFDVARYSYQQGWRGWNGINTYEHVMAFMAIPLMPLQVKQNMDAFHAKGSAIRSKFNPEAK